MSHTLIFRSGITGVMALSLLIASSEGRADESLVSSWDPYVGGFLAVGRTKTKFGGFNTAGAFSNKDQKSKSNEIPSIVLGVNDLVTINDRLSLRGELEYNFQRSQKYVSASFPGLPNPAFFYRSRVKSQSGFVNGWIDFKLPELGSLLPITAFAGGGVGFSRVKVTTNDNVVGGTKTKTNVAFNVGGGLKLEVAPGVEIVGMARYIHMGRINVPLVLNVGGASAGNLSLKSRSVEARVGVHIALSAFGL